MGLDTGRRCPGYKGPNATKGSPKAGATPTRPPPVLTSGTEPPE